MYNYKFFLYLLIVNLKVRQLLKVIAFHVPTGHEKRQEVEFMKVMLALE